MEFVWTCAICFEAFESLVAYSCVHYTEGDLIGVWLRRVGVLCRFLGFLLLDMPEVCHKEWLFARMRMVRSNFTSAKATDLLLKPCGSARMSALP